MEKNTVLCVAAHPDDTEFQCAGTLALLADKGWDVHIATMTAGDAGSATLPPEEITAIRRKEAADSVSLLNGNYHCLECRDLFVLYDEATILAVTRLFREVRPTLVITHSPSDYIVDHEITSRLARTACMAASVPNVSIEGVAPCDAVPHLYYMDPMQGTDIYGTPVASTFWVDIDEKMELKTKMLCAHASQREWLLKISEVDEYVLMMKRFAAQKGREAGTSYAEGFRQHLGFSYPTSPLLQTELSGLVRG